MRHMRHICSVDECFGAKLSQRRIFSTKWRIILNEKYSEHKNLRRRIIRAKNYLAKHFHDQNFDNDAQPIRPKIYVRRNRFKLTHSMRRRKNSGRVIHNVYHLPRYLTSMILFNDPWYHETILQRTRINCPNCRSSDRKDLACEQQFFSSRHRDASHLSLGGAILFIEVSLIWLCLCDRSCS
jgi:hypothetical protein